MLKKDDIIEVTVESLAFQGQGIAKPDNFTVFVPRTAPGDHAKIEITQAKKKFGFGKLHQILTPSTQRVEPACAHFKRCGGCHYQHIDTKFVQKEKATQVTDIFSRMGPGDIKPLPLVSGEAWHYRNRVIFNRSTTGAQGYKTWFDNQTMNIETCLIADQALNEAWNMIKKDIQPINVHVMPFVTLRKIQDQIAVIFSVTKDFNTEELKKRFTHYPDNYFFYTTKIAKGDKKAIGGKFEALYADPIYLEEKILDTIYIVRPDLFFQTNIEIAEKIVQKILGEFGDNPESILDVYCGSGLFSIPLAQKGHSVTGIEVQKEAINCANQTSMRNMVDESTTFITAKAQDGLQELIDDGKTFKHVLVDPPRRGLDASCVELISDIGAEKVIYISCDPTTLARDAKAFKEHGFSTAQVQPFEMFPHTYHLETVAIFEKKPV